MKRVRALSIVAALSSCLFMAGPQSAWSQVQIEQVEHGHDHDVYKLTVNVVEGSTPAINYRGRSGETFIDFRGTDLLPDSRGVAKIESKHGYEQVVVDFDRLQPASRLGAEYLTYVLWAITPEGRAINMGELQLDGDKGHLDVTTDMQTFGLVVTAEPYFAVRQPSNMVVMENVVRKDTKGRIEVIDARYELLERGQYIPHVAENTIQPFVLDKHMPLDLYEARNAVRIAAWAGAKQDAAGTFGKAEALLKQAEMEEMRKSGSHAVSTVAREAVQTAEDAREIAVKHQAEARAEQEREAAAAREAVIKAQAEQAQQQAAAEAASRAQAEEQRQLEAERRAQAEADAARAKEQADLAAQQAEMSRQALQAEADRARLQADMAQHEKEQLRQQLVEQLNRILETRDTARGLIVNMSDVLFATGQWDLKPGAREKLAKIAGIVLSHPGLRLQLEGHTDSVGSEAYNQVLSERRADTVRDFLIQQGVNANAVTARGFGKSMPVADNATAAGRQQNRRVEMVVSGDVIGQPLTPPTTR
jgi:outer membrane protein OmpA-like peptidoglycan-associated protein